MFCILFRLCHLSLDFRELGHREWLGMLCFIHVALSLYPFKLFLVSMLRVCLVPSCQSFERESATSHNLSAITSIITREVVCVTETLASRRNRGRTIMSNGAMSNGQRQLRPHPHVTSKESNLSKGMNTTGRSHKAGGNSYYMLATRLHRATILQVSLTSEIHLATGSMPNSTSVWTIGRS